MIYEILLMLYVLGTIAGLWFVFKKAGVAPWKAVVPLYNIVVWVQVCGKKWPWYVYFLIPGINIFMFLLLVVETAKVFRRTNFWEQTGAVLAPCIYLPVLGLKNWEYHNPKTDPPQKVTQARDWAESIVFALIAAVLIRGFVFELFTIPSSSMERSLRVGDHLLVSKLAYGPRVIMTPLALPLMHNTIVGTNIQSYLDWPQLPYYRFPGYTHVKRYDAVVFNFPAGDTILSNFPDGKYTYYEAVQAFGREAVLNGTAIHPVLGPLGSVKVRPVDKRENYIKRCMGLPGDLLEIKDGLVYINGNAVENPRDVQFTRWVTFLVDYYPADALDECGVSREDIEYGYTTLQNEGNHLCGELVLSSEVADKLMASGYVAKIEPWSAPVDTLGTLYPHVEGLRQSIDNYGPVRIPAKGETIKLTLENLPWYRRAITAYEHNTVEVKNGTIYINGAAADSYTFKMDYYWMMGDNRHRSQDSRYWGFVPEDHIVGKAKWVLFSKDADHGGFRWDRILINANNH